MKIQEIKVEKLIPYEFNNKKHDETQINRLANSIKEFWFIQPIVIDKNNIVIIWHWRLEWAKKLWLETVPCVKAETLTDEQVRKLRVLDNKLNESERDIENLQYDLSTIPNFNIWDLEISVDELFDDLFPEAPEEKEIVDVSVRPQKEAKLVKRWDIFELWNHRLMCWDSTDENDVDLLCAWTMIDIAFTSPPYNAWKDVQRVSAHHEKWKTIRAETTKYMNSNDDKDEEEYRKFLSEFTENSLKHSQFSFVNIQSLSNNKLALIDFLYDFRDRYADTIIRDKWHSAPAMWENVLNSEYEYIHIFSHKWNRAIWTIPFRWTLKNIIHISRQQHNDFSDIHNATFSIEFAEHFIKNFAKESVLDLFWWTWTSMIVAEQLWKKSFTMEIDPLYCEVCIKRFHDLRPDIEIKCTNRSIDLNALFVDE